MDIENNRSKKYTNKKEGMNMATLAKPINKFVREFNKNKVSKDFMVSCEKASRLFGKVK